MSARTKTRGDLLPPKSSFLGDLLPPKSSFLGDLLPVSTPSSVVAGEGGRRVAKQGGGGPRPAGEEVPAQQEEVPAQQGRRSPLSSVNAGEEVARKRRKLGEEVGQSAGRRWQLLGGGGRADGEEEDGQPSCDTRRIAHALRSRELSLDNCDRRALEAWWRGALREYDIYRK